MKHSTIASIIVAAILIAAVGSTSIIINMMQYSNAQDVGRSTVVRDSQTILLEGKTLPAKDFIHLYDSTPYMIMVGHIAVKLPCDSKSESPYKILIGQAPNLKAADFELVKELSKPGQMCIYHVDIKSQPGTANGTITDIALQNPTDKEVKFSPTATVVIGVDEIAPLGEQGGAMVNMTMSNSTG
ncbi:MAG: hypothetical protein ABJB85_09390 [Nitrososphaerota archaeon]